jgi:hypothetical protein
VPRPHQMCRKDMSPRRFFPSRQSRSQPDHRDGYRSNDAELKTIERFDMATDACAPVALESSHFRLRFYESRPGSTLSQLSTPYHATDALAWRKRCKTKYAGVTVSLKGTACTERRRTLQKGSNGLGDFGSYFARGPTPSQPLLLSIWTSVSTCPHEQGVKSSLRCRHESGLDVPMGPDLASFLPVFCLLGSALPDRWNLE